MKYPKPEDWPEDETRIDAIGQNGNDGDSYMLKSLLVGDKFILDRTDKQYELRSIGKTNSKVRDTNKKTSYLNNQCVVTKLG